MAESTEHAALLSFVRALSPKLSTQHFGAGERPAEPDNYVSRGRSSTHTNRRLYDPMAKAL
jgi:hypothetical protein